MVHGRALIRPSSACCSPAFHGAPSGADTPIWQAVTAVQCLSWVEQIVPRRLVAQSDSSPAKSLVTRPARSNILPCHKINGVGVDLLAWDLAVCRAWTRLCSSGRCGVVPPLFRWLQGGVLRASLQTWSVYTAAGLVARPFINNNDDNSNLVVCC